MSIGNYIRTEEHRKKMSELFKGEKSPKWKGMNKNCEICGKKFHTMPSRIKKGGGRFCSKKCFGKWWSKKVECKCLICGNIFFANPSRIKQGENGGKFCSRKCSSINTGKINAQKYLKKRVKRICKTCKKEFLVKPSIIKKNEGIFCSHKCSGLWVKKNMPNKETSIERAIGESLKKYNIPYIKQCPIENITIADFLLPDRIVIQCDGDYWHRSLKRKNKDINQDFILGFRGYRIFRFKEKEINKSADRCILKILKEKT